MDNILYKKELDIIKLKCRSQNLTDFRSIIMALHNSIDTSKIIVSTKQTKLKVNNRCLFDIVLHLYHNKQLDIKSPQLINILETKKYDMLKEYINNGLAYTLIDDVNELYNNNMIPNNILYRHVNKYIINTFVECNIIDYILNSIHSKYDYSIKYKNITINLCIYGKQIQNKELHDILTRIILIGLYKSTSELLTINIELYMTPYKKNINNYIKSSSSVIGPRETNSGFSISDKLLCVYRSEELNKVLVHELIHYLELDLGSIKFKDVSNHFNINPNTKFIRINEAYTEILGIIINTIINSPNIHNTLKIMDYELTYSCYQVAKILHLFKFETAYEFFYNKYDGKNKFKQNTSIFSYFILKSAIMYNLDDFLEKYLNNSLTKYNFTSFILEQCSTEFINIINDYMNYIKINKKSNIYYTLRMTCYK